MTEIKVKLTISTDTPEETLKCINKYLKESLENDFIQGNEEIVSIEVDE
jgi:hypothetical protein